MYVLPQISVAEVVRLYASDAVRLNVKNVAQSLTENNYLVDACKEKQVNGKRKSYWWFKRETFSDTIDIKESGKWILRQVHDLIGSIDKTEQNASDWEGLATLKNALKRYWDEVKHEDIMI